MYRYLVLEFCHGTVEDYVSKTLKHEIFQLLPPEPNALYQMASGLNFIHSRSFVHRDIKPANVLFSKNNLPDKEPVVLKISDFGLTKPVTERSKSFTVKSGVKGTPLYLAPEYRQLNEKTVEEINTIRANVSIDIFSMGCLFHTYITGGQHPFATPLKPDENQTVLNITNGEKNLSENGKCLALGS